MKFIVTAGGHGKKLWPYSRVSCPKQFQSLIGEESLFSINIKALLEGYSASDIFISTKKSYFDLVKKQAPSIPMENYIYEPDIAKDRGPAEGLAFLKMSLQHPNEPFMVVQADDLRLPNSAFLKMIRVMEKVVKRDKKYITGGVKAAVPVMGNDYLKLGDRVETESNIEIFKAKKFLGRSSDYETTKKMIEGFHVVIHCNHGCWYPELMLDAYKKYRPDWHAHLMDIAGVVGKKDSESEVERIYRDMEKGPTEEVTKNILPESYVVLLPFKWTDIGTWGSYYNFFAKPGEVYGNCKVISTNSSNCLVRTKDENKLVSLYNLKNLAVIDTGDVLMVLPIEDAGKVGQIVEDLKKQDLIKFS